MRIRTALALAVGSGVLITAVTAVVLTRNQWQPWLFNDQSAPIKAVDPLSHDHKDSDRVRLSAQARGNLKLVVKPIKLQTYWRSIDVPGLVIDSPGRSDRGFTAPVAGVVKEIHALPGDTVRPGENLVTLRLVSDSVVTAQTELFKTTRELQFVQEQKNRLGEVNKTGSVPEIKLIEIDSQLRRLKGIIQAYRQDLLARGLTTGQIDGVAEGKFVTEITVIAPKPPRDSQLLVSTARTGSSSDPLPGSDLAYEIQEIKVQMGEQVQAGQMLGVLANHQNLLIEGRAFKHEAASIEQATQEGWPLQADFSEAPDSAWPKQDQPLQIRYLANTMDAASRTFPFFIPLSNSSRSYEKDGKTFIVWRYRPGQRVRLQVPVEQFKEVFVMPAEGLVRKGAEAYVFRQNGDFLERKAVTVVFEDRGNVVIGNDGSIGSGLFLAHNAAASLNRILKSQAQGEEENHGHDHAGHSHDH
jgi:cobalt-zinc-cadmium efflux system membrane fusion protein